MLPTLEAKNEGVFTLSFLHFHVFSMYDSRALREALPESSWTIFGAMTLPNEVCSANRFNVDLSKQG